MALIAKRKVGVSWRQAVAARAAETGVEEILLAGFDGMVAGGSSDLEAAFRVLEKHGLLWHVVMPGDPVLPPANDPEDVPAV